MQLIIFPSLPFKLECSDMSLWFTFNKYMEIPCVGIPPHSLLHFIFSLSHCLPLSFIYPVQFHDWLIAHFCAVTPTATPCCAFHAQLTECFIPPCTGSLCSLCLEQFLCGNLPPPSSSYCLPPYSAQSSGTVLSRHAVLHSKIDWHLLSGPLTSFRLLLLHLEKFTELRRSQNSPLLLDRGQASDLTVLWVAPCFVFEKGERNKKQCQVWRMDW